MNYPTLTDFLTQEKTEFKPEINGVVNSDFDPIISTEPIQEAPQPNSSDFDTPPPPPVDTVIAPEPSPEKPRLTESEYRMNAELTVALVDGFQMLTVPYLYQQRLYSKEEKEMLKAIKDKKARAKVEDIDENGQSNLLDEKEQKLMLKYMAIEELKKDVPFSEHEKEVLITPLAQIYSKYNIQIGPEYTLLAGLLMVMTPRVLPFFSGIESNF